MGIQVRWYNDEKTILYQELSGRWTLAEFQASVEKCLALLDSVSHPVYRISYIKGRIYLPEGMGTALPTAIRQHRPHERHHYFVGGGLLMESGFMLLNQFDPSPGRNFVKVESLAEAEALIRADMQPKS